MVSLNPGQNTGVIEKGPEGPDYIAGVSTPIVEVIRQTNGDWRPYEPAGEWQKLLGVNATQNGFNTGGVDFLDCVSFSANDVIEVFSDQQIATAQWPAANVQWLRDNGCFNADGKTLNFSDRFTAKMSGTTINGNSLQTVGQSIHTTGLVAETLWPMPTAEIQANPADYWNIYYKDIPASVIAKGQEFLKYFTVQYEWVFYPGSAATLATIENSLKLAPLQIATAVCGGWNGGVLVNGCGAGAQHATALTYADGTSYNILDHYVPFDKTLALNYDITYAMRYVITPIIQTDNTALQQKVSLLTQLAAAMRALLVLLGKKPVA